MYYHPRDYFVGAGLFSPDFYDVRGNVVEGGVVKAMNMWTAFAPLVYEHAAGLNTFSTLTAETRRSLIQVAVVSINLIAFWRLSPLYFVESVGVFLSPISA